MCSVAFCSPRILLLVTSMVLLGCEPTTREIGFSVANTTLDQVTEVIIKIGENPEMVLGSLLPNTHSSIEQPMRLTKENSIFLRWSSKDGKQQSTTFKIPRADLTDAREIQFLIETEGNASRKWRFP